MQQTVCDICGKITSVASKSESKVSIEGRDYNDICKKCLASIINEIKNLSQAHTPVCEYCGK